MNTIRISLATLVLTLGFGLVSCEKAPEGGSAPAAEAPAAEAPAAEAPAPAAPAAEAPAEQPK